MENVEIRNTDVLIIGGGGAGCRAAIECASSGCRVLLASKYPLGKSGATVVAESFYAAPLSAADPEDSPEHYFRDTVQGGCLLCNQYLAQRLAWEGCDRVRDLERYGVRIKKDEDGRYRQLRGPGHSYARAINPVGGGLGIIRGLQKELSKYNQLDLLEDVMITNLLTCNGTVSGAVGLNIREGIPLVIECKAVIIATGGYSRLWSYNDVPCDCTGDGVYMAYRAGAELIDMEMVLFYPTVIIHPPFLYGLELPHGLLLEQVRAKLLNGRYEEFVPAILPTRDIMVSLIYKELAEGRGTRHGGVFLDASKSSLSGDALKDSLMAYLPEKYAYLLKYGIDIAKEPLEVAPMAHYTLGGVRINADCETKVGGLYAAGEVEGNVHGANRLAGNALPETQVFGAKGGEKAAQWAKEHDFLRWDREEVQREVVRMKAFLQPNEGALIPSRCMATLQGTMWNYVGVNRNSKGLEKAIREIERMKRKDLPQLTAPLIQKFNLSWVEALEFAHMLELCQMVARSALMREETRGHHFRLDFPERDDKNWINHILIRKEGEGMRLWTEPANKKEQPKANNHQ